MAMFGSAMPAGYGSNSFGMTDPNDPYARAQAFARLLASQQQTAPAPGGLIGGGAPRAAGGPASPFGVPTVSPNMAPPQPTPPQPNMSAFGVPTVDPTMGQPPPVMQPSPMDANAMAAKPPGLFGGASPTPKTNWFQNLLGGGPNKTVLGMDRDALLQAGIKTWQQGLMGGPAAAGAVGNFGDAFASTQQKQKLNNYIDTLNLSPAEKARALADPQGFLKSRAEMEALRDKPQGSFVWNAQTQKWEKQLGPMAVPKDGMLVDPNTGRVIADNPGEEGGSGPDQIPAAPGTQIWSRKERRFIGANDYKPQMATVNGVPTVIYPGSPGYNYGAAISSPNGAGPPGTSPTGAPSMPSGGAAGPAGSPLAHGGRTQPLSNLNATVDATAAIAGATEGAKKDAELSATNQNDLQGGAASMMANSAVFQRTLDSIAGVKKLVDWDSTGLVGQGMQFVGGSKAKDLHEKAATLSANIRMNALQSLKGMSKTGASGLGALSDSEGRMLEATLASLDQAQSTKQYGDQLKHVEDVLADSKKMLQYNFEYENRRVSAGQPFDMKDYIAGAKKAGIMAAQDFPEYIQQAAPVAPGAQPARTPSSLSIQHLKGNPDPQTRALFDQAYGAGASAHYLGGG